MVLSNSDTCIVTSALEVGILFSIVYITCLFPNSISKA